MTPWSRTRHRGRVHQRPVDIAPGWRYTSGPHIVVARQNLGPSSTTDATPAAVGSSVLGRNDRGRRRQPGGQPSASTARKPHLTRLRRTRPPGPRPHYGPRGCLVRWNWTSTPRGRPHDVWGPNAAAPSLFVQNHRPGATRFLTLSRRFSHLTFGRQRTHARAVLRALTHRRHVQCLLSTTADAAIMAFTHGHGPGSRVTSRDPDITYSARAFL